MICGLALAECWAMHNAHDEKWFGRIGTEVVE